MAISESEIESIAAKVAELDPAVADEVREVLEEAAEEVAELEAALEEAGE